jgi:hypothetical protein
LKVPPTDVGAAGLEVEVEEGAEMKEVVGELVDEGVDGIEISTALEVGTEPGEDVALVLGTDVGKTGVLVIGVIIALELEGGPFGAVEVRPILVGVAVAEEHHALSKAITVLAT